MKAEYKQIQKVLCLLTCRNERARSKIQVWESGWTKHEGGFYLKEKEGQSGKQKQADSERGKESLKVKYTLRNIGADLLIPKRHTRAFVF